MENRTMHNMNFALPLELREWAGEYAKSKGSTASQVIREALIEFRERKIKERGDIYYERKQRLREARERNSD